MEVLKKAFGDNQEQIYYASWEDSPLMVLAGPGVGKTQVLTHRIGYLLRQYPKENFKILALTFTNKAAKEMKERLKTVPGYKPERVWTGTYHSFAAWILHHYSSYLGIPRAFTIIEPKDQEAIIELIKETTDFPQAKTRSIARVINTAKSRLLSPSEYEEQLESQGVCVAPAKYYEEYEKHLKLSNLIDFDGLIFKAVELFETLPTVLAIFQNSFQHILIDECQDTTYAQHKLLTLLCPQGKSNLFVVADEDQSIYEWNNARVENLREMIDQYGMEVRTLQKSYRCPQEIVEYANRIMLEVENRIIQRDGELYSEKAIEPERITVIESDTCEEEGLKIVEIIIEEVLSGRNFSDISVIARTAFLLSEIEIALIANEIPYKKLVGSQIEESELLPIVIAGLQFIKNPDDSEAFKKILCFLEKNFRPIFVQLVEFSSQNNLRFSEVLVKVKEFLEEPEISTRISEIFLPLQEIQRNKNTSIDTLTSIIQFFRLEGVDKDLINLVENQIRSLAQDIIKEKGDYSLQGLLERISLVQRGDLWHPETESEDQVKLMSVHAAKGSENQVIILAAMEENSFPHYFAVRDNKIDEERRNAYVAITRTQEKLYLSWAKSRKNRYGRYYTKNRSRFIID